MVGTWQRLAHVELGSDGATLDSGVFTAKENLRIEMSYSGATNGAADAILRVGNETVDSGSNYAQRTSVNGASDVTATSQSSFYNAFCWAGYTGVDTWHYTTINITNIASKEKIAIGNCIRSNTAGAGNVPWRVEAFGKWTNTSAQINRITLTGSGGSSNQNYAAGSYITVWGASDDTVSDEKTTLTGGLPIGTRYEETDTRKIYRSTSVYSSVDSTASSLTDVPFDASTQIGDITYSGNELTRSADTYARHGLNSNFYFRNSGTQTVECVAQNTGTSSWVFFGLSASKLVDDGANTSTAPNQMAYGIKAADDGRTWIKSGADNSWTQVSDTSDNTTFKITNNRTTVTYYVNGSSVGSTTHGTPASTYYVAALVSQTGTDGSFVFDYSGDITTLTDNGWKERGTA